MRSGASWQANVWIARRALAALALLRCCNLSVRPSAHVRSVAAVVPFPSSCREAPRFPKPSIFSADQVDLGTASLAIVRMQMRDLDIQKAPSSRYGQPNLPLNRHVTSDITNGASCRWRDNAASGAKSSRRARDDITTPRSRHYVSAGCRYGSQLAW